jgi:hypothetical protein
LARLEVAGHCRRRSRLPHPLAEQRSQLADTDVRGRCELADDRHVEA